MAKSKASKKEKSKALKKDSTPARAKTYIFTAKERVEYTKKWIKYKKGVLTLTDKELDKMFKELAVNPEAARRKLDDWIPKLPTWEYAMNQDAKKVSASNNNPQSTLTQKIGVNEKSVHYKSMADLSKALLNELNNQYNQSGIINWAKKYKMQHITINGGMQISLNDHNIIQLQKALPNTNFNIYRSYIQETMLGVNKQAKFEGCKLLIQFKPNTPPQTTHCDVPSQYKGNPKKVTLWAPKGNGCSGIMLLQDGLTPQVFKTCDVKLPTKPDAVFKEMNKFEKMPDKLKMLISEDKHLMSLFKQYGILFFANQYNRPTKPNAVKAHDITIFESNQPHYGPGNKNSDNIRVVVFFTMNMHNGQTEYDDEQCSLEELVFNMILHTKQSALDIAINDGDLSVLTYLYKYLAHVLVGIAQYGADIDMTIKTGDGLKTLYKTCQVLMIKAREHFASPKDPIKKNNMEEMMQAIATWPLKNIPKENLM